MNKFTMAFSTKGEGQIRLLYNQYFMNLNKYKHNNNRPTLAGQFVRL